VCGDIEQMPLAAASVELAFSNLALPWVGRPDLALQEFNRVLERGGLLMFTTLGPDTLIELRAALGPDGADTIHPFVDMHDLGDLLVHSGFADPVMDMERLTLTYGDLDALVSELHASGGRTARMQRPPGLRGRAWRARLEAGYAAFGADNRLPLTYEVVYGHAWKPEHRAGTVRDGRAVVRFERRGGGR
jgi:malonyl-CoA O-methyltransferase